LAERRKRRLHPLEWFSGAHALHTVAQTEFARTLLWPTILTMLTGGAGVLGHIPAMYVIVASGVTFAVITTGLLRASEYRERRTPLNKIVVLGVQVPVSLTPTPLLLPYLVGNRRQRRSQAAGPVTTPPPMLSDSTVAPGIKRTLKGAQVGVLLRDNATFPISCILENAETEIATLKPPRSRFPKESSTLSPGATFVITDESIDMAEVPAGKLTVKLSMLVSYGLPGKEIYDLSLRGDIY
jgi:hypothetical protein